MTTKTTPLLSLYTDLHHTYNEGFLQNPNKNNADI